MKKSNKICIIVLVVVIFVIGSIYASIYFSKIGNYESMLDFPVGYSDDNGLTINEKVYRIASIDFDNDRYLFKGIDESNPYHIITSKCKAFAVINDFVIYPSIDDPDGLIFTTQDNFLDVKLEYYSENIKMPDYNKNSIRQLLIVFSPIKYPSSGYTHSINNTETITSILNCIENNTAPTEIISQEIEMPSDVYSVWIDYSDYPMYELIFSGTSQEDCSVIDN